MPSGREQARRSAGGGRRRRSEGDRGASGRDRWLHEIAGPGDPAELGLAEYFAEDGSAASPPALERVPGAPEDDIFRWREKLADLAGY